MLGNYGEVKEKMILSGGMNYNRVPCGGKEWTRVKVLNKLRNRGSDGVPTQLTGKGKSETEMWVRSKERKKDIRKRKRRRKRRRKKIGMSEVTMG